MFPTTEAEARAFRHPGHYAAAVRRSSHAYSTVNLYTEQNNVKSWTWTEFTPQEWFDRVRNQKGVDLLMQWIPYPGYGQ